MSGGIPKISVIVPVHNGERSLPRLMESLRAQDYPRDRTEIVLVDNRSTDRTVEVMHRYAEAIPLSFDRWPSSYAARNVGVEHAAGEILAFIDADCWAHPQWLSAGVGTLMTQGLDRVAGRVEFVLSKRPNIYEIFDSRLNFRQADFVNRGWSGAGNLFVRRDVMREVGPWDEHLISHGDAEFGMRATHAGKTLGYEPNALMYHRARTSLVSLVRKWIRTEYGAAQVYRRHGLQKLHLWHKKANYRPLTGVWRDFPPEVQNSVHLRLAIDGIANILRLAGNFGNFLGYCRLGRRYPVTVRRPKD